MENLSCATPVVANIGGNSDIIEYKTNEYLPISYESQDLANGIEWILNLDKNEYNKLCKNAREKVLKEFDSRVVSEKYIKLYKELIKGTNWGKTTCLQKVVKKKRIVREYNNRFRVFKVYDKKCLILQFSNCDLGIEKFLKELDKLLKQIKKMMLIVHMLHYVAILFLI